MAKVSKEYDADSIEVVQNIEHIQKRPAMYVADLGKAGIHQLVKEIVDNAVDEYMAGHVTEITVKLDVDDNSVWVLDNGRGIPVDTHKKSGMSALSTVFLIAGAGGKFGAGVYKTSAGLHGVGVTVVTALSEWLDVWSVRGKKSHHLRFENGVCRNKNNEPVIDKEPPSDCGLAVHFKPSATVFKKSRLEADTIKSMLKELSYLSSGLTIHYHVTSGKETKKITMHSKGGLVQMLLDYTEGEGHEGLHEPLRFMTDNIEAAILWTDSSQEEYWRVFCNSSFLPEGGTPVTGLKRLITQLVASKSPKPIDNDDVRIGLHVAMHVKVEQPEFAGQSKRKLLNKDVEKEVYDSLYPLLETFCQKNPKIIENILKRALKLKSAREKFEKEREATKNITLVSRNKRGILPDCLAAAPNCTPDQRELYLVEGESAGGSAKQARYASHQEILALKGKIPNAMQKNRSQMLENEEIQKIITSISSGIEDSCKPSKARVGKVMLLMDADPDGSHIVSLVLSFFVKYMRPLIDDGRVYVVDSPLFKGEWQDKNYYGMTREDVMKQLPKNAAPMITRYKGHGECVRGSSLVSTSKGLLPIKTIDSAVTATTPSVTSQDADIRSLIVTEDRKVFEVTTRYGYNIACTGEHKFIVFDASSGRLLWKKLKNIQPGDYVALDRTPVWPSKAPRLLWSGPKPTVGRRLRDSGKCPYCSKDISRRLYGHLREAHGKGSKDIKGRHDDLFEDVLQKARYRSTTTPTSLTPELARILGYLVGDGSFDRTQLSISHGLSEEAANDSKRCFETCFPGVHVSKTSYTTTHGKTAWDVSVTSKVVLDFLYEACGLYPTPDSGFKLVDKTYNKVIPAPIMQSPRDIVVEFLRAYFECDGSSTRNKVEVYSASKELIHQLRTLLLKFGIITKGIFEQKTNPFTSADSSFGCQLYMEGLSARIFHEQIGFVSSYKNNKYTGGTKSNNTNIDVIPGLKNYILFLRDKYRVGENSHTYEIDGRTLHLDIGFTSIAKEVTYEYLEKNKHLIPNIGQLDADLESVLYWLLERRPFWDKVSSIIPSMYKETVYDINVPDGSSYVVDGFITHNSPWQDLRYYAMDANSRKLLKVEATGSTDTIILQTMGQDTNFRKTLLGL